MLGRPFFLTLTLVVLSTGCAVATEPVSTPTNTMPWNILDCHFVYATFEVPAAKLTSRLPANWRPYALTPTSAGLVADFALEANDCAEGSGVSGQIEGMEYVSAWSPVSTPARYDVPGLPFVVANWDVVIPDDERRAILADAGASAHDGSVTFGADLSNGMPLAPFAVDYEIEGIGAFRFDIAPLREITPAGAGEFGQYTIGEPGSLTYWRTKWAADRSYQGTGVVTLPEGSWHAEVLGATSVPARFSFGTWDYFDGKIVLPTP